MEYILISGCSDTAQLSTCHEVGVRCQQGVRVVVLLQRRPPQQAVVRLLHPQTLVQQFLHVSVPLRCARRHAPDGVCPAATLCVRSTPSFLCFSSLPVGLTHPP